MIQLEGKVYRYPDGSFVIRQQGMPYHVCGKDLDPHNLYDVDEIAGYVAQHPDQVEDVGPFPVVSQEQNDREEIASLQAYMNSTDWMTARFVEEGVQIPTDVQEHRSVVRKRISELRGRLQKSVASQ